MKVYTTQISRAQSPYLDITVKSGRGAGRLLAPSWDLVLGYKRGHLSEAAYREGYLALLRERYRQERAAFLDRLRGDEPLHLACYCRAGGFCHRYLAVEVLGKLARAQGLPFEYLGETPAYP